MHRVRESSHITLVGSPGSGKSFIARHVALELMQKEQYHIVPVNSVEEILLYGEIKYKQLFIHDDILGVFGVDVNKENSLEKRRINIVELLETAGSKLIMTCRSAVFNTVKQTSPLLVENIFQIDREEYKLTKKDKMAILTKHCIKKGVNPDKYVSLSLESAWNMFPLLCNLFANQESYQDLGDRFFSHPYDSLLEELNNHQARSTRDHQYYYPALVMCMINGGKLSETHLPATIIMDDVYKYCELPKETSIVKLLKALEQLIGTYTVKTGSLFSFIHDSLFEVVAHHFGMQYPNQILSYSSASFIANMVTVEKGHNVLCIQLQEIDYPLLAERLYKDIQDMELNYVFRNAALKHNTFIKIFEQMLQKKPYSEIKDIFLQHQDDQKCASIVEQGNKLLKQSKTENVFVTRSLTRSQDTLMDKRIVKDNSVSYHIRVLSWVVFYGHNLLLRYLIDLNSKNNDSRCVIFGNTKSEQTRLLTLASCSGDLDTLNTVLEYVPDECLDSTLLETKEDFETKYKNRHRCKTPLTAEYLKEGDAPICISRLIEKGAKVHKMDASRHVPVFNAAYSSNRNVLKALLDARAKINYGNNGYTSPLFTAVSLNHIDAVRLLIEFGASVNKGKFDNTTPLFRATERGNLEIAEFLIKKKADVNMCDIIKRSPLHGASIQGCRHIDYKVIKEKQCQVVELLLKKGAKINATDKYNRSPLFLASHRGYYDLAKIFLQHSADPNIVDSLERSPLFVASQKRYKKIVDMLLEYGANKKINPNWTYKLRKKIITLISLICICFLFTSCLLVFMIFR